MSIKLSHCILILILCSSSLIAQTTAYPTKEHISNLVEFRESLLLSKEGELAKINRFLEKFSVETVRSEHFTVMIFGILFKHKLYNYSTEYLAKHYNKYVQKPLHHVQCNGTITKEDIESVINNGEFLEMIMNQVLKPQFPFNLDKHGNFFKEFAFYEIKEGDTIGEVGAGIGGFAMILAIIEKQVDLHVNELEEDAVVFLKYRLESQTNYLDLNNIKIIQGDKHSTNLHEGSCDKIIIRNAIHHFSKMSDMLDSIKKSLKVNGALYLYEPLIEYNTMEKPCSKVMREKELFKLMSKNGFQLDKSEILGERLLLKYSVKR